MAAKQKHLDLLDPQEAMRREDYILGDANQVAFALLESWPEGWSARKLALTGPAGSGKTHLARIWAERAGATLIEATDLPRADIPALAHGPVGVENVTRIAGNRAAEEALFHLHNLVLAEGHSLLVTDRMALSHWPLTLPDLKSRMQACPAVTVDAPDEALLGALLIKHFADRQIMPAPDVIPFLLPRMERSYAGTRALAAALDSRSLQRKRPITRNLASEVLRELARDT